VRRVIHRLPIGTRSILFGAHQLALHPWFVVAAWIRLYGWPWDLRLWLVFVIHDLGYWGKPNMDGAEGETHPEWAARVMGRLFGPRWYDVCLLHSRFYANTLDRPFSRLCVADKLAIALTPAWLYLPMVRFTGELDEYRRGQRGRTEQRPDESDRDWYRAVQSYCRAWAYFHREGCEDTWTAREVADAAARAGR